MRDQHGYQIPEWSHLAAREQPRFTEPPYKIMARDIGPPHATGMY